MVDIAEQICLAVDQIVNERLKSINYDTTIVATIVDDRNAKDYKYICSNGSSQFVAFSKDTSFKKGDSVQVTIPNNDYDKQKVIVGKYVIEDESPYVFIQPFETLIDVSGNLINDNKDPIQGTLLANKDGWELEDNEIKLKPYRDEIHLWTKNFDEAQKGYARLGLKGSFRSWINALKPISGDYGYRLEIFSLIDNLLENQTLTEDDEGEELAKTSNLLLNWINLFKKVNTEESLPSELNAVLSKTPEEWFPAKPNSKVLYTLSDFNEILAEGNKEAIKDLIYLILHKNCQITELRLSSKDMYGNPYNFQNYYEQEQVFDISELGYIYGMSLYFYEESATFFNENNEPLPFKSGSSYRDKNLFTIDPYVCLGYDLSAFNKEEAILYCTDSDQFYIRDNIDNKYNKKIIRLRWLHKFDDGNVRPVSESTDLKGYEIRWYRYKLGNPSADEYSGVYWERTSPIENPDTNTIDTGPTTENSFNFILNPAPNVVDERIKAIVLYNGEVIRSNILTFTNSDPDVVSGATSTQLSGLTLWCQDGSYGNYFVYGQNNNILESSRVIATSKKNDETEEIEKGTEEVVLNDKSIQILEARFADATILADPNHSTEIDAVAPLLTEATEIVWQFPLKNTMLVINGFNYNYETDGNLTLPGYFNSSTVEVINSSTTKPMIKITRIGNEKNQSIDATIEYRINKTYSATNFDNTVLCSITKNNIVYSASKEFSFGLMGTNGTDVTLVVDFDNNVSALTADTNETVSLTARLFDQAHNEVDLNDTTKYQNVKVAWSWYKYYEYFDNNDLKNFWNIDKEEAKKNPANYNEQDWVWSEESTFLKKLRKNTQFLSKHGTIKIVTQPTTKKQCWLTNNFSFDIIENEKGFENDSLANACPFLILQVDVEGFGDYTLTTYKTIPIRRSREYRYALSPTDVIYSTTGYPDYYKDKISLWKVDGPVDVTDVANGKASKVTDVALIRSNPFLEEDKLIGIIKNDILKPVSFYTANSEPYGIVFHKNNEVLWVQPLMIMQNNYPSATLNRWDGKTVEINDTEGTIIAPAIAAGKKNSDNTFSGVMLGDWEGIDKNLGGTSDEITRQTGIYGFHHGGVSYAFKEDGTAFIGKSGFGRIEFKGDSGIITSSKWLTNEEGMFLDLDDGILKMQKKPSYSIIYFANENEFNNYKNKGIFILKSQYYLIPRYTHFKKNEEKNHSNSFKINFNGEQITLYCDKIPIYTKYYYNLGLLEEGFYNKNKDNLYYKDNENYLSPSGYNSETEYYEIRYQLQRYNTNEENENWNQGNNDEYYTYYEDYILVDTFNSEETYYKLSETTEDRYITLSADEDSFPLSIGSDSIITSRKFKVHWDGTCYIEDGKFNGTIEAETGYLGDLELEGYLASNKNSLYDFKRSGFWLDEDGLNIGSKNNYFLATTEYTGFYNNQGALRISGQGLNLYGFTSPPSTSSNIFETLATSATSAIEIGWKKRETYGNPYIRLGGGSETSGAMKNAGAVKKFGQGMWIGNYGIEQFSDAGVPAPDSDSEAGVDYYNSGLFVYLGMGGTHHGGQFLRGEVYRYDKNYKAPSSPAPGEQVFPDHFVPIKYAVFA